MEDVEAGGWNAIEFDDGPVFVGQVQVSTTHPARRISGDSVHDFLAT